ncbi:MAG TPA: thiamine-phosphate kinase [Mariprofundaceae bacterium]|nr:thiamine-phosphate kinase [Mariprofundaceae bacterium]
MGAGEFELINSCFRGMGGSRKSFTRLGIGDDASIHELSAGMELVVSTDTSVEGVHWPTDFDLSKAADRAVCAALSDLAAMGAEALAVWLNVMARDASAVEKIGEGATAALRRYDIELAGGDTTRSVVNALSITVAGQVPEGKAMRRDRADVGDAVWLVGKLGFSALGIEQWMGGKTKGYFVQYLDEIRPKLEAGVRLRDLGVKCCIDISDGLVQDAGHICDASGLGMDLEVADVPGWELLCKKAGEKRALRAVTGGGEDYALLFTAPASLRFLEGFAVKIGRCSEMPGVRLYLHGEAVEVDSKGYDHFG